jgi:arylsulfatase A-like enzyme
VSAEEKRLFGRMAEVYAGFLAHADHHIGRLLDYLEETGGKPYIDLEHEAAAMMARE